MVTAGPPEKTKMERNKRANANRDPEKRNPHFSLTMEVKQADNARLQSLRCQLDHAKSLLGIDRKTSSTQNAGLLERLLNCFELVMSSAVNLGLSSVASLTQCHTRCSRHQRARWNSKKNIRDLLSDQHCGLFSGTYCTSILLHSRFDFPGYQLRLVIYHFLNISCPEVTALLLLEPGKSIWKLGIIFIDLHLHSSEIKKKLK